LNEINERLLVEILHNSNVDLILDVGANKGQFALSVLKSGYRGEVLSFEPQSEAHNSLVSISSAFRQWNVAPRCALGSSTSKQYLNISKNSVSSSLLNMEAQHLAAAPSSAYIGEELVDIIRLDDIEYQAQRPFLKIDTQGFEGQVLDGARETLRRAVGVQIEISMSELYLGQPSYLSILQRLDELGFRIWDIKLGFRDNVFRRLLQADVIMFKL
jgi:FkbM family methyltransferase